MKKVVLTFALLWTVLFTNSVFSQVGIGTMNPDDSAMLDVFTDPTNPLGVLIPRMSQDDRDNIKDPANGLLIYNTDEDCVNYYSVDTDGSGSWNSLCGGVSKSTFTVVCDDIHVHGAYMQGTPLGASNYLTITVNVAKPGLYTLSATTDNGYGFNASGTFLTAGLQQISLAGQGSPTDESDPGDEIGLVANGIAFDCSTAPVIIPVAPANPTFTMDCGSVTVNGSYSAGTSLKPANTISIDVNITALGNGQWSAETNTVDGISFSGNGIFTSTGTQTIILLGHGTPTSPKGKNMTITVNSTGITRTCSATVNCLYTLKKIAVMGSTGGIIPGAPNNTYGYELTGNRVSYRTVMAPVNFGTTPGSTVAVQGFNITGVSGTSSSVPAPPAIATRPTDATLQAALVNKPDIVIIGWGMIYSPAMISAFTNYLNDGGVMIIMNKYSNSSDPNNSEAPFFTSLFKTPVTAATITNTSGAVLGGGSTVGSILQLASVAGDPILKGPFGDLNGLLWGNDYYPATYMSGIPAAQIVTYSGANVIGSTSRTGVTMFRHKTLNLFWVGDGGFISNERVAAGTYISDNIEPFATDEDFRPIDKPNFGSSVLNGGVNQTVCNARLFCNVLAWAIQQAENNGINAGNKHSGVPDPEPEPGSE